MSPAYTQGWGLLKVWLPGNRFSDLAAIPTSLNEMLYFNVHINLWYPIQKLFDSVNLFNVTWVQGMQQQINIGENSKR